MALQDDAIVLRLVDYSETSQITTLMTRATGVVRLIAKGVRRSTKTRFSPGLDLMERGRVVFTLPRNEAQLGALIEWTQIDGFRELRRDLDRLYAGLYAIETAAALTHEHDPHPLVFDAMVDLFETLAGRRNAPQPDWPLLSAVVRYQAALLRTIGYAPNLKQCTVCGREAATGRAAWFSARAGGLVCRACAPQVADCRPLPARLLDPDRSRTLVREWFDLLNNCLQERAGRDFRTVSRLVARHAATRRRKTP
ncbi:MAG: DNA repair protein RecO [Planctomycetota bacterium]|nr:MAG: DNA repair protein RecO [Planctomycetota bacterium]